jgi:hypothetical protein
MKKKYGHPRFYELVDEISELHSRKNHDYAGKGDSLANFKECKRIGISAFQGCIIRMMDKYMRIGNFMQAGEMKVKDESVKDTLRDLAVYSLIAIILWEENE